MGWNSQDDLILQLTTNGKGDMVTSTKTLNSAGTAGAWTLLSSHNGWPIASTFAGTDLTYVATDDTWSQELSTRAAMYPLRRNTSYPLEVSLWRRLVRLGCLWQLT